MNGEQWLIFILKFLALIITFAHEKVSEISLRKWTEVLPLYFIYPFADLTFLLGPTYCQLKSTILIVHNIKILRFLSKIFLKLYKMER